MDNLFEGNSRRTEYEKYQKTQPYTQEIKRINDLISDFNETLLVCNLFTTRDHTFSHNSIFIWGLLDVLDSTESIRNSAENGFLHPAKRELRYVLETLIKFLYTDQKCINLSQVDRIDYFHNNVPNSGIQEAKDILGINKELLGDIRQIHHELCAHVHPSKKQIEEYKRREQRGSSFAFESHVELSSFNRLLFRSLDAFLYLIFLGIGRHTTGDVFINILDDKPKWSFKKGKHTQKMSKFFDYKLERKQK